MDLVTLMDLEGKNFWVNLDHVYKITETADGGVTLHTTAGQAFELTPEAWLAMQSDRKARESGPRAGTHKSQVTDG